ncbi:MFS transporter [Burkholderia gladioli]|nr:MFS transporter [Burkholderia gladioli]MDN7814196.1 MFS transporter [Burkholderia gladioli]
MFHSLRMPNYRRWASGALVSNIGTWMQRTAQDWLVLTGLSHHSARAVGIVMALQFAPQILLIALNGFAADRLDRRRLLFLTQGLLALGDTPLVGWVADHLAPRRPLGVDALGVWRARLAGRC